MIAFFDFIESLQYGFMQNAVAATLLTCIACGIIGVFVVTKKIVSLTGGISHASFGGVGLSYFLGLDPLLGLLPFSILSAIVLGFVSKKTKVSEDTAIGILWSLGVAAGVIFIYLTPGYAPDLMTYLFGNILTVPSSDIYLMVAIDLIIIFVVLLLFKEFVALCFDEEYTEVSGLPSNALYIILLCLIALSVVAMIKVVGMILIIAMLTIPASISRKFTYDIRKMIVLSSIIGMILGFSGLALSYIFDMPSGAMIIICMGFVYLIISGLFSLKEKYLRKNPKKINKEPN
ncbi:MAG: metal ABC transporter permease [Methanosarcinaceae archaeon]|nr:metal ABC transporter permease [Methanosarcinaceae archaeon]